MKKYLFVLAGAAVLTAFTSCGSTPTAEPELDIEPAVETEEPAPGPELQPEEQKSDFSETNTALLAKAESARQAAVDSGAQEYYGALFNSVDVLYTEVKSSVQANPAEDCSEKINDVIAKYDSLAKAAEAKKLKEKADGMEFSSVDKSVYDAAEKALGEYDSLGASASGKELLAKAEAAYNSYNVLLLKGYTALAGRERNAALAAKKDADSVRAGVAKKDEYTKASDVFKKADSSYVTKDIEGAYNGYKAAKEVYAELFETVSKNRAAAQAAIERAKQKVAEAKSYSAEADEIAPLQQEVAGIEKEDAVLLKEDNLANPEDSVIDVEEGATAEMAEKTASAAIAVDEALNKTVDAAVESVSETVQGAE